ncbi:major histocompatibility complex class I-related gene protein-like isoform X2 [Pantherophis guttatus]|uniref:Major histocompatibility complex class I-related gene protein-like isoform X2 n=1 Tax=Pantherophis guttatus TaxID=94885 RepID=A0A6P9CDR4_PANGU|nr:major histocompatibility complex class I-related gene protein-like isoform X2 [Pantherophis guttatus]
MMKNSWNEMLLNVLILVKLSLPFSSFSQKFSPLRLPSNQRCHGNVFSLLVELGQSPARFGLLCYRSSRSASFFRLGLFRRAQLQVEVSGQRMALRSAPLWLLVLVARQHVCLGFSSHSFKIVYFTIFEPSQRLSHFFIVGYVDGQIFAHYDSNSRKIQPRVSWMEKSGKDIPQYWQALTDVARNFNDRHRDHLEFMRIYHNQRQDDMLQGIASCELQGNGSESGFYMEAYNGKARFSFPMVEVIMENCIELLKKCLSYGNETLLTIETPVVTMTRRTEAEDGLEMHVCRVHGFYPREIDASWRRDGEVWMQDTLHGSVAPNADGTYHYWLGIQIDPKERDRYRCHVEHDGLQEPLALVLKVPESNLGLIIGCVVAALVLACVIVGSLIFLRSHSSGQGIVQGAASI